MIQINASLGPRLIHRKGALAASAIMKRGEKT